MSSVGQRGTAGTAEVRAALERALGERRGTTVSVTKLERRPCAYRTSFALEEIDVELADGIRLRLMMKNLSRTALHEHARAAKPDLLYDPVREIHVYRDLLDAAGLGTAEYHGSSVDPARDRWWLFIENVVGDVLWQVGEFDIWEEAARWLARMHGLLGGRAAARGPLLRYDRELLGVWAQRAAEFADDPRSSWSAAERQQVRALSARYDMVAEQLDALAPTFIHGEFYPSNVLVQRGGGTPRVCPIDWELAAVGPGLFDLAALSVGKWTSSERARLAAAYRGAAPPGAETGAHLSDQEFARALDFARLHLAVQWLGWEPRWTPPVEHRHNWLAEALELAERLGV
jgi:aminoglycoside phosphotransferase (APT) family kinase protein